MRRIVCLVVTGTALAVPSPARAQERRVTPFVAGAVTAPLSGTADHFNPGFGAGAGVTWNLTEQSGVRLDYVWSTLTPKPVPADVGQPLDIAANVQYLTATFKFQGPPGRTRLYILGGGGVYRRAVTISGGGSGMVSVCNPWWFVCEPNPVPGSSLNGTRSSTDLGVNIGFGVTVGRLFAELRYHYAFGPSYDTPQGETPASGKFLPLLVGVTF
jgi:hypothetical protein